MNSFGDIRAAGGPPAAARVRGCDVAADRLLRRGQIVSARLRRRTLHGAGLVLAVLAASCAVPSLPPLDPSHPASPEAAEAVPPEPATILGQPGGIVRGREGATPEMQHGHGLMHGGSRTMQHGAGGAGSATGPADGAAYGCPMHPDVRHSGPGRCPRCGMALRKGTPPEQEEGHGH